MGFNQRPSSGCVHRLSFCPGGGGEGREGEGRGDSNMKLMGVLVVPFRGQNV